MNSFERILKKINNKNIQFNEKDLLRVALQNSNESVWYWDVISGEIIFEDQWAKMLGYRPGECLFDFNWWQSHVDKQGFADFEQALKDYREGRKDYYQSQYRIRSKSGKWMWVSACGQGIEFDQDGSVLKMLGTHIDVSKQKEVGVLISNLAKFPNENPNPVMRISRKGKVIYKNAACDEFLGHDDLNDIDFFPKSYQQSFWRGCRAQRILVFDVKSHKRFYSFTFSPVLDEDYVNVYGLDITERKLNEQRLRTTSKELEKQRDDLENKTRALAEVLDYLHHEKQKFVNMLQDKINKSILPIVEKIHLAKPKSQYVELLKKSLVEWMPPSSGQALPAVSDRLSSRELEICSMVKNDLASKEIASLLGITKTTVDKHRRNIRNKLGISSKNQNLTTYLKKFF